MSVKLTDDIVAVYSVELVVQEQEEGPIVAITSLPEFKPPTNHQMSSLNVFQFPPEAFSLFEKLQIDFKGGKETLSKSSPLKNSLRGTVVLAPARVRAQWPHLYQLPSPPSPPCNWPRRGGLAEEEGAPFPTKASIIVLPVEFLESP